MKWGCSSQPTSTMLPTSTQNTALLREERPQDDHGWNLVLKYAWLKMGPILNEPETLQHLQLCGTWFPPSRLQHSPSQGLRLQGWFPIAWAQKHAGDREQNRAPVTFPLWLLWSQKKLVEDLGTLYTPASCNFLHRSSTNTLGLWCRSCLLNFFLADICNIVGSSYIRVREMRALSKQLPPFAQGKRTSSGGHLLNVLLNYLAQKDAWKSAIIIHNI